MKTNVRCMAMGIAMQCSLLVILFSASLKAEEIENVPNVYILIPPKTEAVIFKNQANYDNAGVNSPSILYPAPNVAGLLAAIITHGAIIGSVKKNKNDQLQLEADKSLIPYQGITSQYMIKDLVQQGLPRMTWRGDKQILEEVEENHSDWIVQINPTYSISPDQTAIILSNLISISGPGIQADKKYQNTVKVVSPAIKEADPIAFWTANNGEKLKDQTAELFAQSIDLALNDANSINVDNPVYKTLHYFEGSQEKIERGQVIKKDCVRLIIKTLRGWIISSNVRTDVAANSEAETCK